MRNAWLAGLVVGLFLAGGAVAYLGTRDNGNAPPPVEATPQILGGEGPLPNPEPRLPEAEGMHTFAVACTTCHSTRLVLTQPTLNYKQWQGVVEKMIKVYGAAIRQDQVSEIVTYLNTVHGTGQSISQP